MRKARTAGLALIGAILLTLGGVTAASATGSPPPNTNEVAYWCEGGHGIKYDGLTSTSFVVPAPPNGFVWTLLVLKAGSDQSVETGANETFPNPVVGQSYSHSSGKTLSHAILCKTYAPTTTQGSTTTAASTTLATTTTLGTTTTQGSTTTIATTTTKPQETTTTASTSTTIGTTTTAATTTVPQTTTTSICDVSTNCRNLDTTTTVAQSTTTSPPTSQAVTTTAPPTTIPDTTAIDQTVVTAAPTKLPVTGSSTTPEILLGLGAIALGLAGVDYSKQRRKA